MSSAAVLTYILFNAFLKSGGAAVNVNKEVEAVIPSTVLPVAHWLSAAVEELINYNILTRDNPISSSLVVTPKRHSLVRGWGKLQRDSSLWASAEQMWHRKRDEIVNEYARKRKEDKVIAEELDARSLEIKVQAEERDARSAAAQLAKLEAQLKLKKLKQEIESPSVDL